MQGHFEDAEVTTEELPISVLSMHLLESLGVEGHELPLPPGAPQWSDPEQQQLPALKLRCRWAETAWHRADHFFSRQLLRIGGAGLMRSYRTHVRHLFAAHYRAYTLAKLHTTHSGWVP